MFVECVIFRCWLCSEGSALCFNTQFNILSQEEAVRRGVYSPQDLYTFPATRAGESSTLKVNIRNNSSDTHEVRHALFS